MVGSFHWIVTRHRNFMTFINFLKLNCLDTYRPIKKDKTKEMSLFLRPEEVYIQDPCQLHLLSISQM